MKKLLVTGGTTFVSKYVAEYFAKEGYEVYVLNRNTKRQADNVTLIEADRLDLGEKLKGMHFDAVADITAYTAKDINCLLDSGIKFETYIMISSSAVYPETERQPFKEESALGPNKFWGDYGTNKIAAETALLSKVNDAYILRPPYLYGPMNNVYRESFVFDCAYNNRKFYLPGDGSMKLHFYHVKDLCRLIKQIIETKPSEHILNVGNQEAVTIKDWVCKCYAALNKVPEFVQVPRTIEQRNYFSFYDYEYILDVTKQASLCPAATSLEDGLLECANWYLENRKSINRKAYFEYIDSNLRKYE